ncbi:MAG: hypothetical protein ACR2OK_03635 [Parvibaculales bacterium]|nr:hypothetical protein [Alphaproteobacteria bacterium]
MKQSDDGNGKKNTAPKPEQKGGDIVQFRKPKANPSFDVEWFYEEEEFFAEFMDAFDW